MKKLVLLTLSSLIVLCCQENQPTQEKRNSEIFLTDVEEILNQEIPKLQSEQNVPAVGVGLIEDGKIRFIKVYGEHQLGKKATENTVFNVASIAKVITTMTVLKLIDDGNWKLDEPLFNYWIDPDIINDSLHRRITTRHSLTHTTGFNNWRRMNDSGRLEFDFEPGDKYQYSGEGMEYLKIALENKFNKDFGELADSLVFKPLDMNSATLKWIPEKDTLRFAKWYDGNGNEHDVDDYSTPEASAADDLLVTVEDLAKFGISVMDTTLINKSLFLEMVKPQIKIHDNVKQGLGWTIVSGLPNNNYALNHDGGDMGVATTIILLPNSKSGIIVFTNGDNGRILCNAIVKKAIKFGDKIIQKLYWGGEIPEMITINHDLLQKYSGAYQTNQNTVLSFIQRDNALKIVGEGVPGVEIYPKSDTEFFPTDFEVFFEFVDVEEGLKFELKSQGKIILEGIKSQ
ncbi:serine hydrolase [Muricauda sp. JGD-17]|uniref:Serine hydrolase n=1 Tax=Flagellimonas ochracea TaxID=2696472 RepID=A0A964TA62_9FLAO|nr:serine hydrolase domain-containing protein [Allomuricauda ochracea]NAY91092.1 serine hydrolase [Allomuricauda ochracea]